jgi:tRNA G18 (ribose-2'-O)-methylase SpoU
MTTENFVLILPNIRSRHNVGAIFRTADGAGVDKMYLTGYIPQPPHKDIDKVALGAEKTMPWQYVKQTTRLIKKLKAEGFVIVGLEQSRKSVRIYEWQPQFPLALVLGNEVTGVPRDLQKLCDLMVEIPMYGMKNSLNVSIATGVMLYHISRFKF